MGRCDGCCQSSADQITEPYDGVRHIDRTTATPNRIHIVEVDLTNPKVRVRATRSADRRRIVSSFADLVGCEVAINGDFFSFDDYSTSGMSIGRGAPWADSPDNSGSGFVAIGVDNQAAISAPSTVVDPPEDWMSDAVGGHPMLVRGGERIVFDPCTGFCARNPRTAVGIDEAGTTLYLVTIDGRSSSSAGMNLNELGQLMVGLGAHRALNLDGGGSTTMFVDGDGDDGDGSEGDGSEGDGSEGDGESDGSGGEAGGGGAIGGGCGVAGTGGGLAWFLVLGGFAVIRRRRRVAP